MHKFPSDKGWLRQNLPHASTEQIQRFVNCVNDSLAGIKNPSQQQINCTRMASYPLIIGVQG